MTTLQPDLLGPETAGAVAQGEGAAAPATDVAAAGSEGCPAAATPQVIGIDLSLTSTGIAGADWATTVHGGTLPRKGATLEQQYARLTRVRAALLPFIDSADLVVLEGPAFSQGADPGAHERAGLWWRIVGRCLSLGIPIAIVSTGSLKVYATGSGKATKEDIVQAVATRRPSLTFRGNDQADALTLAAMGLDHLGHPPLDLPQTHRRALDSVTWPEVTR